MNSGDYYRLWYKENRERVRILRARFRSERQAAFAALKAAPCTDCGGTFPPECMDFDHVRGEKKFDFGSGGKNGAWEKVLEEIAKCDLVCANCHRIRTKRRADEKKHPS